MISRSVILATAFFLAPQARAASDLAYTQTVGTGEMAVIDTRPLSECKRASLPRARCLPASDLIAAHRQLPSERDLLWLFGTLGLTGEENVLVIGDTASGRDFVGGLLYLAGQRQVRILNHAFSPQLAEGPGQERGQLRTTIFTQPVRDEAWLVHPNELDAAAAGPMILAPDAYTAIIRFTRQVAAGGQGIRVGWNLHTGGTKR